MSDDEEIVGIDGHLLGGLPTGSSLGGPMMDEGGVGVMNVSGARGATAANIKAASRYWREARPEDFHRRDDGLWLDKASGRLYERRRADPLLSPNPGEIDDISMFAVADGVIHFLGVPGSGPRSLAEAEEHAAEVDRATARKAEAVARFRSRQPQTPLNLSELPDSGAIDRYLTLKGAAQRIESLGGEVTRGQFGLKVTIPRVLTPDLSYDTAPVERAEREAAALAAMTLCRAEPLVLAAVDANAESRRPKALLSELLPDVVPAIGSVA
jgi:hypothetical protein